MREGSTRTTVVIPVDLRDEAKACGINISAVLRDALARAVNESTGKARRGEARRGLARLGEVGRRRTRRHPQNEPAIPSWRGMAGASPGGAPRFQAWLGSARHGEAWRGTARPGRAGQGKAGRVTVTRPINQRREKTAWKSN